MTAPVDSVAKETDLRVVHETCNVEWSDTAVKITLNGFGYDNEYPYVIIGVKED